MLHGTDDTRTDSRNSEDLLRRAAAPDKSIVLYPGARHQLLQDIPSTTNAVTVEVIAWLDARSKR